MLTYFILVVLGHLSGLAAFKPLAALVTKLRAKAAQDIAP